jgi:multidrug efflux pump
MVGMGIIKQSTANTIDVARAAKAEMRRLNPTLPEGMEIKQSYDTSVFVEGAIKEVYKTLLIAIGLVILVIYLFLGSVRATLVPAVTVPVSIIASFIVLNAWFLGQSAHPAGLVLAIGLVVDDAIVVWKISTGAWRKKGNPPGGRLQGTRQVGFAVIATSLVLVAVFVPIAFLQGDVGRLFSEFAITMAAAVCFSSIVALSLSPMLASKILKRKTGRPSTGHPHGPLFRIVRNRYRRLLSRTMKRPFLVVGLFAALVGATVWLFGQIPTEYAPKEDRGAFFVIVNGPEGASYAYMEEYMDEIERRLMPFVESQEATRLLVRAPRTFSNYENFNTGIVIFVLNDWDQRRSAWAIMG